MRKPFIAGLLLSATVFSGCESADIVQSEPTNVSADSIRSDEDVAAETVSRMLKIARKGNWEAYVDDYYGEQRKFRSTADRDALVQRFEEKWGKTVVQGLSRAVELTPQIEADKAIFLDGEATVFILHRSRSGEWKFHL